MSSKLILAQAKEEMTGVGGSAEDVESGGFTLLCPEDDHLFHVQAMAPQHERWKLGASYLSGLELPLPKTYRRHAIDTAISFSS